MTRGTERGVWTLIIVVILALVGLPPVVGQGDPPPQSEVWVEPFDAIGYTEDGERVLVHVGQYPPAYEPRCWGTVSEGPLNVRERPWGTILGQVQADDTLALEALTYDGDGAPWYKIWFDLETHGFVYANLVAVAPDADCSQLPEEPPPQALEPPVLAFHGYQERTWGRRWSHSPY